MADPVNPGGMTQMGVFPVSPSPASLIHGHHMLLSPSCQPVLGLGSRPISFSMRIIKNKTVLGTYKDRALSSSSLPLVGFLAGAS